MVAGEVTVREAEVVEVEVVAIKVVMVAMVIELSSQQIFSDQSHMYEKLYMNST